MPALSDYAGGKYLQHGWHLVTVKKFDIFEYNSGSPGVELTLEGQSGMTKLSLCLKENILWLLASFAQACGLSEAELKGYNTDNRNSHKVLMGKRVRVLVIKDGKFHKVDTDPGSWARADEAEPRAAEIPPQFDPSASDDSPPQNDELDQRAANNDIPF